MSKRRRPDRDEVDDWDDPIIRRRRLRRRSNLCAWGITLGLVAGLTLAVVGAAAALVMSRSAEPSTVAPFSPRSEPAKSLKSYAHLLEATADEVRAELGAPDSIESDPGDPFHLEPAASRATRWVYHNPSVSLIVQHGRVVVVD